MPNGAGATKWVGSIAVTAALIFTAVLATGDGSDRNYLRGSADGGPETVRFSSSGQWATPPRVTQIFVRAIGGRGGGKYGGRGLDVRLEMNVPVGSTLEIVVGENGTGSRGGGCAAIYISQGEAWSGATRLALVAPGGGGQGASTQQVAGGRGGDAGTVSGQPGGAAAAPPSFVGTDPASGLQYVGTGFSGGRGGGGASGNVGGAGATNGTGAPGDGFAGGRLAGGRGGSGVAVTDVEIARVLGLDPALVPSLVFSPSKPTNGTTGGDGGCGYGGGGGGSGGFGGTGGGGGGGSAWADARHLVFGQNNSVDLAALDAEPSVSITWTPVPPAPEVTDPEVEETAPPETQPEVTTPIEDSTTTTEPRTEPLPGEEGVPEEETLPPEDTLPAEDTEPITDDSTGTTTPGDTLPPVSPPTTRPSSTTTQAPVLTLAPKPGSTAPTMLIPTATTSARSAPRFVAPAAYPITGIMQVPRALKVRGAKVDKKSRAVCRTLTQFVITISKGTCRLTVTISSGKKKTKVPIQFTVE